MNTCNTSVETLHPRVFVCAACDLLASSDRAHTITCSTRCRVRLHRHPELASTVRAAAAVQEVPVSQVLECAAIMQLRPDLVEKFGSGEDVRADVYHEFIARALEDAAHVGSTP